MSLQDPISDFIAIINNASRARHKKLSAPHSRLKEDLCRVLLEQGYILSHKTEGEKANKRLLLQLKYSESGKPVIEEFKRKSKPSLRVYVGVEELPSIYNGFGEAIVSTSKGLMTAKQAKERHMGGEVVCTIF